MKNENFAGEEEETEYAAELTKLSTDQLKILKDIRTALEDMDISIDQLAGIMGGVDPWKMQRYQKAYGRAYDPMTAKKQVKGSPVQEMKNLTENWNKFLSETQDKK